MMKQRFRGLIAATFTPLAEDGALDLGRVPSIVDRLLRDGVEGMYVCGTTGEGPSLSTEERMATAEAYIKAARGRLPVIVQVGHDSLVEAGKLAAHAQAAGADAVAAIPPYYYKLQSLDALIETMGDIASKAPDLPFFYYHIPSMTGAHFNMIDFLEKAADRLPNLVGIKYSAPTIYDFQACVDYMDGRYIMLFGTDEMLLSALSAGAAGAVGSTYNFAAPLYLKLMAALRAGDWELARNWQGKAVALVRILSRHGGPPALKAMMRIIDVDCGPNRLPLVTRTAEQRAELEAELAQIGYFTWGRTAE